MKASMSQRLLEVCVDNYESALNALSGGANRLELCSALTAGGLTPTAGLLKQIQSANPNKVPVFCMLRCRAGNFVYSQEELLVMLTDAQLLKQHGADGFVFGALLEAGEVDMHKCREVVKTCYPLPVTFHRAFDVCASPLIQLECIIDLGFSRLLTSGQKDTAEAGVGLIRQLIKRAKDRIVIVPGAGIYKDNIQLLMNETEAREYHGAFKTDTSKDKDDEKFDFGSLIIADTNLIAEMIQILRNE